jgi:hypothetical protein
MLSGSERLATVLLGQFSDWWELRDVSDFVACPGEDGRVWTAPIASFTLAHRRTLKWPIERSLRDDRHVTRWTIWNGLRSGFGRCPCAAGHAIQHVPRDMDACSFLCKSATVLWPCTLGARGARIAAVLPVVLLSEPRTSRTLASDLGSAMNASRSP